MDGTSPTKVRIGLLMIDIQLRHSKYKEGNQEAIFYTAAVWMWNSDLETGNFVPPGATALGKVSESRL